MLEISWLGFARGGVRRRLQISAQGSASAARRGSRRSPNDETLRHRQWSRNKIATDKKEPLRVILTLQARVWHIRYCSDRHESRFTQDL
jgi:hypothetical protein